MPIEVEKKYRLTAAQRAEIEERLRSLGLSPRPVEFEENTLYRGGAVDLGLCSLRLRRVNGRAMLTFKKRLPSASPIKHQLENECEVANADGMDAILRSLGYTPGLIYEKRRTRWHVDTAKVVIDQLPFGLFMEVEASEEEINRVEELLKLRDLPAVAETYPNLTVKHGIDHDGIIEARFGTEPLPVGSR